MRAGRMDFNDSIERCSVTDVICVGGSNPKRIRNNANCTSLIMTPSDEFLDSSDFAKSQTKSLATNAKEESCDVHSIKNLISICLLNV